MKEREMRQIHTINGMTCGHCALSVTEEVSDIPGVREVDVDLDTGRMTVVGDVPDAAIATAVEEAGYELAS
jgi:copper chaperone CopZ